MAYTAFNIPIGDGEKAESHQLIDCPLLRPSGDQFAFLAYPPCLESPACAMLQRPFGMVFFINAACPRRLRRVRDFACS